MLYAPELQSTYDASKEIHLYYMSIMLYLGYVILYVYYIQITRGAAPPKMLLWFGVSQTAAVNVYTGYPFLMTSTSILHALGTGQDIPPCTWTRQGRGERYTPIFFR